MFRPICGSEFQNSSVVELFWNRSEFLQFYDDDKEDAFAEDQVYGGLPAQALMKTEEDKMNYLKGQLENVYLRDIVHRYDIRLTAELEDLLNILALDTATLTNPTKLASTFSSIKKSKISANTIDKFIGYFEDSFKLKRVYRYDVKGRKYIGTPYKLYFEDVGLRNARLNFRQIESKTYIDSLSLNMLGLDHAKNLQEKRPQGWFDWQDLTAESVVLMSKGRV